MFVGSGVYGSTNSETDDSYSSTYPDSPSEGTEGAIEGHETTTAYYEVNAGIGGENSLSLSLSITY